MNDPLTTHQLPTWQATEPPKDGTEIIAVGKVMWQDEFSTTADPFVAAIKWLEDKSGYDGWHYADSGLTVARCLDDDVIVHYWSLFPTAKPYLPAPIQLHQFEPNEKHPWICGKCGYAAHEVLMHTQTGVPKEGGVP